MKPAREKSTFKTALAVCLFVGVLSGCRPQEPIRHYSAPKDSNTVSASQTTQEESRRQLLGAIVPWEKKVWFFKMTGPRSAMDGLEQTFLAFIQSIRFENAEPTWTLPKGWEQQPGSGMRFATVRVPSETTTLEMSVISLGLQTKDLPTYILQNVNRWRAQLNMRPLTAEQLPKQTVQVPLDGTQATLINYVGSRGSDGMHGAVSGGMPPGGMPPGGMPGGGSN